MTIVLLNNPLIFVTKLFSLSQMYGEVARSAGVVIALGILIALAAAAWRLWVDKSSRLIVMVLATGAWWAAPICAVFGVGFGYVGVTSLALADKSERRRKKTGDLESSKSPVL